MSDLVREYEYEVPYYEIEIKKKTKRKENDKEEGNTRENNDTKKITEDEKKEIINWWIEKLKEKGYMVRN